ncbi:MAG: DUF1684 domain-containing protein [Flavobacteriales bacterium]|nr:MAG: DUF1684 domain-containing protein [Flavobacteriales bacterium]
MMRWFAAVLGVSMALGLSAQAEDAAWADSLTAYWARINADYRDPGHSPLLPQDRERFTELERFAPDVRFRVLATFRPKAGRPFGMRTTTDRLPQYQAVGQLRFTVAGRRERLTVFQNIDLARKPGYEDYLFVPFTDLTNGEETYGGGRYLDLRAPLGKRVELDFNKAYNPYCAYGGKYSCPIPPMENHLEVRIGAGVKAFAH